MSNRIERHVQGHTVILYKADGTKFQSSVSLDQPIWRAFKLICEERGVPMGELINDIWQRWGYEQLSRAVRLFVFDETMRKLENAQEELRQLKEETRLGPEIVQPETEAASVAAGSV